MSPNEKNEKPDLPGSPPAAKKSYRKPRLEAYGDVRDLTLGPSLGNGESGASTVFRVKL